MLEKDLSTKECREGSETERTIQRTLKSGKMLGDLLNMGELRCSAILVYLPTHNQSSGAEVNNLDHVARKAESRNGLHDCLAMSCIKFNYVPTSSGKYLHSDPRIWEYEIRVATTSVEGLWFVDTDGGTARTRLRISAVNRHPAC